MHAVGDALQSDCSNNNRFAASVSTLIISVAYEHVCTRAHTVSHL